MIDLLKRYFKIEDRDEFRETREKVTGKLLTLDPAGDRPSAGEPERVVTVVAELWMLRAKARVDEAVLHRLGIEH